jgi:LysR family transcriptional regulator of gallate degradation
LAVADHGSFNRAAAARGLSQPALSNSIAQLERRLGIRVLERTRRGSQVNEFGRILLEGARTVDAVLKHTAERVRLKRLGVSGPLRLGSTPSMTLKFLPDLMAVLLKDSGPVQISITEGLDDQLVPALQAGELDLVLGPSSGSALPSDLIEDELFNDSFSIAVGPRHALAKRRSLLLAELKDQPWVLPGPGSAYRRHVEALPLVESIVTLTNRVTVITRLQAIAHNFWRIRAIPLRGAGVRTLSIKWRRAGDMPPLANRLMQIAHELAASYQEAQRKHARA